MTNVIKAGCILINTTNNKVGLIYRNKYNDYTFPKGHKEDNESIMDCAIRETIEETQRIPEILSALSTSKYTDSNGDEAEVYWFLAKDLGESHATINEELKHELIWVNFDEVENKLSYDNLIRLWNESKEKILQYIQGLK